MKRVFSDPERVFNFLQGFERTRCESTSRMKGIGVEQDGEVIAGVLYTSFNGSNIIANIAGKDGVQWLNREFLWHIFHYPFVQCGVQRITAFVDDSNLKSKRFVRHLGFGIEAAMIGAATDGGDVVVYAMHKKQCRFLRK